VATKKESTKKTSKSLPRVKQGEPQTMEELMKAYGGGFKSFSLKQKVMGKITYIDNKKVLLDIGGKSEGLVFDKAFKLAEEFIKTLKVGDVVEGVVLVPETRDGYTVLSLKQAAQKLAWDRIEKAYQDKKAVSVHGKMVNPAGVLVEVDGITGFIPTSQLGKEIAKKPQDLVDHKFSAIIIDFDKDANKVVLSEKEVSEAEELGLERDAYKAVKEGEVFDGVVTTIYDFGCFVRIDLPGADKSKDNVPMEGLVHISELSYGKVGRPEDFVSVGQKVKVKVIGKKNDKLAFSIKQTQKDPWGEAVKKYPKESKVEGKVVKITDFGVFVMLEPGIEGLIHMTKIPPTKKFEIGDEVDCIIEEIDSKEKKLSLGLVLTVKPIGYK
jgi:small subunit ribosomal protein S1